MGAQSAGGIHVTSLLTIGTFDLFHAGHVEFLRACQRLAGHVTVALNPDDFVAEFKGVRPTMSLEERLAVVGACQYVDAAMRGFGAESGETIDAWMRSVNSPRVLAIGSDWCGRDYLGQLRVDEDYLRRYDLTLVYVHPRSTLHSSDIRQRG